MFPGKSVLYLSDKILCVCVLKTVIESSVPPPLLAKKKNLHKKCFPKPHNKQVSSDQLCLRLAKTGLTLQLLQQTCT